jgi:hypothetical protein
VWLIDRGATFRQFRDADGDGAYEFAAPSDEKRQLLKTAGGWTLTALDGVVHAFDAGGRWLSTTAPMGVAKVATYSADGLAEVSMPDGRKELFRYEAGGKLSRGPAPPGLHDADDPGGDGRRAARRQRLAVRLPRPGDAPLARRRDAGRPGPRAGPAGDPDRKTLFVLTAYDLSGKALAAYRRRRRR